MLNLFDDHPPHVLLRLLHCCSTSPVAQVLCAQLGCWFHVPPPISLFNLLQISFQFDQWLNLLPVPSTPFFTSDFMILLALPLSWQQLCTLSSRHIPTSCND
jgi:hypothetical protein